MEKLFKISSTITTGIMPVAIVIEQGAGEDDCMIMDPDVS